MKKDQCLVKLKQRTAKSGDVYAFYVEMLGKYGACQILAVDGKSICYVLLDYLEDDLPEKDSLERLQPYHRESFRYHHQMIKTGIENTPVPRDYRYIGQCGLKSSPTWDSYSWKWPTGEDYYYEERWKSFDETARSAYKKYINNGDFVSVHGRMFRKNTGGLRDDLYQCLTEKDTLEEFPCITYAELQGYSGKLENLLSTAPLLRTLRLQKAGVEVLDLGKTCLDNLELDMSGIRLKSSPVWDSYSWKWPTGEDYYYEERWKSFDETARSAYKKYINNGDFVSVHGRMFRKNTGGLRDDLYQCLTEKDTLEEFPCITYAELQGYSGKLENLLSTAPLLRTLRLQKAGVEVLDLGKT